MKKIIVFLSVLTSHLLYSQSSCSYSGGASSVNYSAACASAATISSLSVTNMGVNDKFTFNWPLVVTISGNASFDFSGSNQEVIIPDGVTVNVSGNMTLTGSNSAKGLTVKGTLNVGGNLTLTNNVSITSDASGGLITVGGTFTTGNNSTCADCSSSQPQIVAGTCSGEASICSNVLPVELLKFQGEYLNNQILLNWQTISERNASVFVVETSTDNSSFNEVKSIKAFGNTETITNYETSLSDFKGAVLYVRLKMVDIDGKFEYSDVIAVYKENYTAFVYPNPFQNEINIYSQNSNKLLSIRLNDFEGRLVHEELIGENSGIYSFSTSKFDNGLYILELIYEDGHIEPIKVTK